MVKCKNPECEIEIPNSMNYCSEDCLRKHIELKKEERIIREEKGEKPVQTMCELLAINKKQNEEIQELYSFFGFNHSEGSVIGKHNTQILSFLIKNQEGVYDTMLDRLSWLCHMNRRHLRENYLRGIESFGIIETYTNEFGVLRWRWMGLKALKNNGGK